MENADKFIETVIAAKGVDVITERSRTMLMLAAMEGKTETVKLLFANGANIEARDRWENTTLMLGCNERRDRDGQTIA